MYKKLNITENHLKILSLFSSRYNGSYYIREIQRALGVSPRTSQLILDDLEKKGVLWSEVEGKIRRYKLRNNQIAVDYMIFAEQYKKICFLKDRDFVREIVTRITPFVDGVGLIFGSYASGEEEESSDIDIFVAGEYDSRKIGEISKLYDIEINVKKYPLKVFESEVSKDHLLKEIVSNHVVFLNSDKFVRVVLNG